MARVPHSESLTAAYDCQAVKDVGDPRSSKSGSSFLAPVRRTNAGKRVQTNTGSVQFHAQSTGLGLDRQ